MIINNLASVRENKGGQLTGKTAGDLSNSETESKKGGFGLLFQSMQQKESNTGEGKTQLQPDADSLVSGNLSENEETIPNGEGSISGKEQSKNEQVTKNTGTGDAEILNTETNREETAAKEPVQVKAVANSTIILENLSPETDEGNTDGNTTESKISPKKPDISSTGGSLISQVTNGEIVETSSAGEDGIANTTLNETGISIADKILTEKVSESLNRVVSPEAGKESSVLQKDSLIQQNSSPKEIAANVNTVQNLQSPSDSEKQPVLSKSKTPLPAETLKPVADAKSEIKVPVFEKFTVQTETVNDKPGNASQDSQAQIQMKGKPEKVVAAPVLPQSSSGLGPVIQVQEEQTDQQLIKNIDGGKLTVQGDSKISPDNGKTLQGENTRLDVAAGRRIEPNHAPIKGETLRSLFLGNRELRDALPTEQVRSSLESISDENHHSPVTDAALNISASSTLGNGIVVENMQNYIRQKRQERHVSNFTTSGESADRELQNLTRQKPTGELTPDKLVTPTQTLFQGGGAVSSSDVKILEEELFWKEQTSETFQIKEKNNTEQQAAGFGRLMEVPIYNFSVRRNLLPGLTQAVLKAASGNQAATETWQKHNFTLENGKNLQVSVRQADGIVYLKLNSSLGELHRLLLQHQDEIRDHLERECSVKIDLQFDGGEDQDLSQFFGGSESGQKGWKGSSSFTREKNFTETDVQNVQKSIRKFGYNRMEWMA